MASEWFYHAMGKRTGPVSSAELRNLARAGTITVETLVATGPKGPWVSAGRIRGLFALPSDAAPTAAAGTARTPQPHGAASEESFGLSTGAKSAIGVCAGGCALVVAFLVWSIATYERYEDFVLEILAVVGAIAFVGLWIFALVRQSRLNRETAEDVLVAERHMDDRVKKELQRLYAEPVGGDEAAVRVIRSLEAVAAKVEIGIDRDFYAQCVANAWAESKQLLESGIYPGFSYFAIGAFNNYRCALEIWRTEGKSGSAFFGGGFGVAGALEGMAVATVLNAVASTASNFKTREIQNQIQNHWRDALRKIAALRSAI